MSGSFLKQKVNSYLCLSLVALLCFWTVLYYFTHKAEAIGANFAAVEASGS